MAERIILGQKVQGYDIAEKLYADSFGTVYLGVKEEGGRRYHNAIKHIPFPDADTYQTVLQDYGYDKASVMDYFEKMIDSIPPEIDALHELSQKDNRYIVTYYDHLIQRFLDPLRFDIFVRMEHLAPLHKTMHQKGMTVGDVIKLGLNMCDALTLCHNNGVLHRDIKETSIFVTESNNYKLGDFSVAGNLLAAVQAGVTKGNSTYMAPETYLREAYDACADIYSLGIVLYRLLNNQRLPFMPNAPVPFSANDKNIAETRRLKGEAPPLPANALNRLGEIIVKACSVKTARYASAEELKKDFAAYLSTLSTSEYDRVVIAQSPAEREDVASAPSYTDTQRPADPRIQTPAAAAVMPTYDNPIETPASNQSPNTEERPKEKKKKGKKGIVIASILGVLVIAIGVAAYLFFSDMVDPVNQFQAAIEESDFTKAAQLYREELKFGDTDKLAEAEVFLVSHADDVKTQYYDGTIEYEDALQQLQEMGKLGIISASELQPMIAQINEMRTSRVAYEKAQESIAAGEHQTAIDDLHKVIQADSNYATAQTQLAEAIRGYKNGIIASLPEYESDKRFDDAIAHLRAALIVIPDDADFMAAITNYEKKIGDEIKLEITQIIQAANGRIVKNSDYRAALEDLRAAAKRYPQTSEIVEAIADIESQLIDHVFAEVDELVDADKFNDAVNLLNDLHADVTDGVLVRNKITEVNSFRPVDLAELVVIDSSDYDYKADLHTDSFGNHYDGRHFLNTSHVGPFAVFNLDTKYTNFSGLIIANQNTSSDRTMNLAIYVDDTLVYSLTDFTRRTGSESFSVDVRGATKLEIRAGDDWSYGNGNLSIVNAQLTKQR